MPSYKITDPTTNKSVTLTGDSPPTEQELNDIFTQVHGDNSFLNSPVAQKLGQAITEGPSQMMAVIPDLASYVAGKGSDIAQQQMQQAGINPMVSDVVGWAMKYSPDIAMLAMNPTSKGASSIASKVIPPFLKATKGIPPNVTRMVLENPDILNMAGTSEAIQGKAQNIIDAVKDARKIVGTKLGEAYSKVGMENPVDKIINGDSVYKSILKNRNYEALGQEIKKTETIPERTYQVLREQLVNKIEPGYSYQTGGTPTNIGIGTGEITGEQVSVPSRSYGILKDVPQNITEPARSYSYSAEGPNQILSHADVSGTMPTSSPGKTFNDIRNEYHAALSGDLFKKPNLGGGIEDMSNNEKLASLTDLKRSLQNKAVYPSPGQQLSPEQGAYNAAIKTMASNIDQLRGKLPGGDKLAQVDDAWHEITQLNERLRDAFKDPYKGQDYLNRILKGNTDWLTSGRNAGKIGAIEKIEQITGKKVLQPALKEMAAAYINNPDVMSLPGFSLTSIISSLVPAKTFLKSSTSMGFGLSSLEAAKQVPNALNSLGLSQTTNNENQ